MGRKGETGFGGATAFDGSPTTTRAGKCKKKARFITHHVAMSDTFMGLSIRYDVTVAEIRKANNLSSFSSLNWLFEVKIPANDANKALRKQMKRQQEVPGAASDEDADGAAAAVEASAPPKSFMSFLNKVDQTMAKLKVDSELGLSGTSTPVAFGAGEQMEDDGMLCRGTMATHAGTELAELRVRDKIQAILMGGNPNRRVKEQGTTADDDVQSMRSDMEQSPNSSLPLDSYTSDDGENDLFADIDVYDL